MATAVRRAPVYWMAWAAFATALVAFAVSLYGSLHAEKHIAGSPLRQARGSAGQPSEPASWYGRLVARGETTVFGDRFDRWVLGLTERSTAARSAVQFVAFVLPFLLGLGAALTGGLAMTRIERSGGAYTGNFHSVMAIMIGGFAAVIGGCMMLSVFVWANLPELYT